MLSRKTTVFGSVVFPVVAAARNSIHLGETCLLSGTVGVGNPNGTMGRPWFAAPTPDHANGRGASFAVSMSKSNGAVQRRRYVVRGGESVCERQGDREIGRLEGDKKGREGRRGSRIRAPIDRKVATPRKQTRPSEMDAFARDGGRQKRSPTAWPSGSVQIWADHSLLALLKAEATPKARLGNSFVFDLGRF